MYTHIRRLPVYVKTVEPNYQSVMVSLKYNHKTVVDIHGGFLCVIKLSVTKLSMLTHVDGLKYRRQQNLRFMFA